MLGGLGGPYIALYVTVIFCILAIVGTLLNRFYQSKSSDLLIDIPPLRFPRMSNVFKKTFNKIYAFLKEATPLFALGALLISTMELTGLLKAVKIY